MTKRLWPIFYAWVGGMMLVEYLNVGKPLYLGLALLAVVLLIMDTFDLLRIGRS